MSHSSDAGDSVSQNEVNQFFSNTSYTTPEAPPKRLFQPWHKPRKQYIRDVLWCSEIKSVLESKPDNNRVLRYFGLPGADFLDIRYFHSVLEPDISSFEFLGLNKSATTDANISYQEVLNLPKIDKTRALIFKDDLTDLARSDSLVARNLMNAGPFDVINLDLCDSFGATPPGIDRSIYSAIATILGLQKRWPTPWLILLTTRIEPNGVDPEVLKILDSLIAANMTDCESFRNQFNSKIMPEFNKIGDTQGIDFFNCTSIGFAKWFAKFAFDMECVFSLRGAAKYSVHKPNGPDMMSFAFRFDPTFDAVTDTSGLALDRSTTKSECRMVKGVPYKIKSAVDVDDLLQGDADIFAKSALATKNLLKDARYDLTQYDDFCQSN